jgi:hypothetical protein
MVGWCKESVFQQGKEGIHTEGILFFRTQGSREDIHNGGKAPAVWYQCSKIIIRTFIRLREET